MGCYVCLYLCVSLHCHDSDTDWQGLRLHAGLCVHVQVTCINGWTPDIYLKVPTPLQHPKSVSTSIHMQEKEEEDEEEEEEEISIPVRKKLKQSEAEVGV